MRSSTIIYYLLLITTTTVCCTAVVYSCVSFCLRKAWLRFTPTAELIVHLTTTVSLPLFFSCSFPIRTGTAPPGRDAGGLREQRAPFLAPGGQGGGLQGLGRHMK